MSYASAVSIRREVARSARPQEHISVSEAAMRHLRLHTDSGGSEPWNPDLTPYMVEPMDRLIDRRYEAVIFIGPARTGKTGALLGFLAYIITANRDLLDTIAGYLLDVETLTKADIDEIVETGKLSWAPVKNGSLEPNAA